MKKKISEALEWFNENIIEKPVTPTSKNLFTVNNESTDLDKNGKDTFHSIVAKLLSITKHARPDIETAVPFLCTRVSRSTTEDWKKLRRVLDF